MTHSFIFEQNYRKIYALKLVEEIIGKIDTEEVLGIIFKNFCIGK